MAKTRMVELVLGDLNADGYRIVMLEGPLGLALFNVWEIKGGKVVDVKPSTERFREVNLVGPLADELVDKRPALKLVRPAKEGGSRKEEVLPATTEMPRTAH